MQGLLDGVDGEVADEAPVGKLSARVSMQTTVLESPSFGKELANHLVYGITCAVADEDSCPRLSTVSTTFLDDRNTLAAVRMVFMGTLDGASDFTLELVFGLLDHVLELFAVLSYPP